MMEPAGGVTAARRSPAPFEPEGLLDAVRPFCMSAMMALEELLAPGGIQVRAHRPLSLLAHVPTAVVARRISIIYPAGRCRWDFLKGAPGWSANQRVLFQFPLEAWDYYDALLVRIRFSSCAGFPATIGKQRERRTNVLFCAFEEAAAAAAPAALQSSVYSYVALARCT